MSWLLIAALNSAALPPTVEFIDSRDDSRYTFVLITHDNSTCKVMVNKARLKKDYDKIINEVLEFCEL